MKKSLLITLACLAISAGTHAQLSVRGFFGINTQKINFETVQGQLNGSTGFSLGFDAQMGNRVYFQPGINYTGKKFKIGEIGDITTNKINVPILVGLRLFKPKSGFSNNIRVFIGPNISTTISERISDAITSVNKDDFKNLNFAAVAGVGLDLRIFFIDLGYKYGLNDFVSKGGVSTSLNGYKVNLGLRF